MGTLPYYKMVFQRGLEDTKKYYLKDRTAWVYNFFSAILFAIISPIVYNGFGLIMANQFWLSVFAGISSGFVFFVFWMFGTFIYHIFRSPAELYTEQEMLATLDTWKHVRKSDSVYVDGDLWRYQIELRNDKPNHIGNACAEIWYLEVDGEVVYTRKNETHYEKNTVARLVTVDGQQRQSDWFFLEKKIGLIILDIVERDLQDNKYIYKIGYCEKPHPDNPNHFIIKWCNIKNVAKIEFELVGDLRDDLVPGGIREMEKDFYSLIFSVVNQGPEYKLSKKQLPKIIQ